jgi:hypothetical protein
VLGTSSVLCRFAMGMLEFGIVEARETHSFKVVYVGISSVSYGLMPVIVHSGAGPGSGWSFRLAASDRKPDT